METGFNSSCQSLFLVGQILYKTSLLQILSRGSESPSRFSFLDFHTYNTHCCPHCCLYQHVARTCKWKRLVVGFYPIFFPLGLSLSLAPSPSRLSIRNNNNRWEPPPDSAWECSAIIAAGTPSTITQRTHSAERGRQESCRDLAAMAHKHGHGRERVSPS